MPLGAQRIPRADVTRSANRNSARPLKVFSRDLARSPPPSLHNLRLCKGPQASEGVSGQGHV